MSVKVRDPVLATVTYVAQLYGVTRQEVYRALKDSRLPGRQIIGGTWVIELDKLPKEWPSARNGSVSEPGLDAA